MSVVRTQHCPHRAHEVATASVFLYIPAGFPSEQGFAGASLTLRGVIFGSACLPKKCGFPLVSHPKGTQKSGLQQGTVTGTVSQAVAVKYGCAYVCEAKANWKTASHDTGAVDDLLLGRASLFGAACVTWGLLRRSARD